MALAHDLGKMPIIPYGEGPFNPSFPFPKSQTTVMAVDVLEVEPLAMVPSTGGHPTAPKGSGDRGKGRLTLSLPPGHSHSTTRSLPPC